LKARAPSQGLRLTWQFDLRANPSAKRRAEKKQTVFGKTMENSSFQDLPEEFTVCLASTIILDYKNSAFAPSMVQIC
jgi:hypothetical protein